ncbi:hypothetical protein GCM10027449_18330 [Sinomonas notoginsengisoli]|uniref:WXG100-like domain-containing protein n=1 Tax=Sinomonas notoginsengisoli TaxID=1457311 RepID=UPI001F38C4B4|nr:hypothetical protein [Sinomonas notoginsengisoli]
MTTIVVDPQRLVECAHHVAGAQSKILTAMDVLAGGLSGSGGMAGADPAGTDWSAAYDPAAAHLLALAAEVSDRLGAHVGALNESAAAYQGTETWFNGSTSGDLVPALAHDGATRRALPEARGGIPFAAHDQVTQMLVNVVGTVWPNGDTDRLRAASVHWSAMATTLDSAALISLSMAAQSLEGQWSPAVFAAVDREREFDSALKDLCEGAVQLSEACAGLAYHIDSTHHEVQKEVASLATEIGVTMVISTLTSVISAGASTVVGGLVVGGRVGVTIARVSAMFQRLAALARPIADKVARLKGALERLAGRIGRWAAPRLPQPLRQVPVDRLAERAQKLTDNWCVSLLTQGPAAALSKALEKPAAALGTRLGESAARRALVLGWRWDVPGLRSALARTAANAEAPSAPTSAAHPVPLPCERADRRSDGSPRIARWSSRPGEAVAHAMEGGRATGGDRLARVLNVPAGSAKSGLATGVEQAMGTNAESNGETEHSEAPGTETVQERNGSGISAAHLRTIALPGTEGAPSGGLAMVGLTPVLEVDLLEKRLAIPLGIDIDVTLPGPAGQLLDAGLNAAKAADLGDNWWKERYETAAASRPQMR